MTEQVDLSYLAAHPEICRPQAESLQRSIAWETMTSRGIPGFKQYGSYFSLMWICGIVNPQRANLIRSSYFWFRHIDDVADGDKPLPKQYQNKQEFLETKRELIGQLFSQASGPIYGDKEDLLLADYYSTAKKLNVDLSRESFAILDTIILDEERARNRRVLSQEELNSYFYKLDLACGDGALKLVGETFSSEELAMLSWAVRTWFNLRDFPKDLDSGIINISAQDIYLYNIDLDCIEGRPTVEQLMEYDPIKKWYGDQTKAGLNYLDYARADINRLPLKRITRFALNSRFVQPAERAFNRYSQMLTASR